MENVDFEIKSVVRYVQFPLFLLSDYYLQPKVSLIRILCAGVYKRCSEEYFTVNEESILLTLDYLNINPKKVGVDVKTIIEKGKLWVELKNQQVKEPMPNINVHVLNQFLTEEMSKKEYNLLLCYLSIQSIIGVKKYKHTTYNHIFSRMTGHASFDKLLNNGYLNESQKAIMSDFTIMVDNQIQVKPNRFRTLLKNLSEDWYLCYNSKLYKGFRGVYVSFKLKPNEFNKTMAKLLKDKHKKKKERGNNMVDIIKYYNELD